MIPITTLWLGRSKPLTLAGLTVLLLIDGGGTGPAQVVLDGKFGTSGALSGPNYNITSAMGAVRGNNLFQSFAQFNLVAGEVANFTGPANIQNILTRVTGPDPSSLDGTIRSGIVGANFFLINPKGIIFGPNAAIDVSGSFAASTADYLKLADGAKFVATLGADDSGLSSAPVSAFGFLGGSPASITVQQTATSVPLAVPDSDTLSLVGGDLSVAGSGLDSSSAPLPSLKSAGGQIDLVSVKSAGEVPLDPSSLSVPVFNALFPVQGRITVQGGASIDASGAGGGRIVIRGGSLLVDNSAILANSTGAGDGQGIDVSVLGDLTLSGGGQIDCLSTLGLGAGGDITLNANSINLDGGGAVDNNGYPSTQISTATGDLFNGGGSGRGGNIVIHTGSLNLVNSAQISSASFGAGDAGGINVSADSILLDALSGTVVQITANTQQIDGGGRAGDIILHTGSLAVNNGAEVVAASNGSGNAGRIDVSAGTVSLANYGVISAPTFGTGSGGNINLTADAVSVDSSYIQAVTTFTDPDPGLGRGGNISITARSFDVVNGGLVTAFTLGSGAGGNIQIAADSVALDRAGSISTTTYASGAGGNIDLTAGALTMNAGASITAAAFASGAAGLINVAANNVALQEGSTIDSSSSGAGLVDADGLPVLGGLAGGVNLDLQGSLSLADHSLLSVSSAENDAGNVSVTARGNITLQNSSITAQAALNGGNILLSSPSTIYLFNNPLSANAVNGNGGVIALDPSFVILNQSPITALVSIIGNGGQVNIASDYYFASASPFNVTTPSGIPGTVTVTAPNVDLSASLVALPDNLLDAETQLQPDCGLRLGGNVSSFIVLGSGGLPVAPGGFVPSTAPAGANDK